MNPVLYIQSLGCDKNLCDSEHLAGTLIKRGYSFADTPESADIAIINTCCFIHDAKEESIAELLSLADLKDAGKLMGIIVTGCLAERYKDDIIAEIPQVDAVLGTMALADTEKALTQIVKGGRFTSYPDIDSPLTPFEDYELRQLSSGGHYAYLKIAEGCDRHCTYCIIPSVRGRYRSVPMEELLLEAKALADRGVRELILVAQETTLYGTDIYGRKSLPELLRKLCRIDGIEWIRLLYTYPEEIDDSLIDTMASEPKICRYIDMPIQHSEDGILKRMGRRIDKAGIKLVIEKLRAAMPDISIRTTIITGFPGESREDYEALYRFVNEMEFGRLGVFTYSPEEGTPAFSMADQVPDDIKEERRSELMELQQAIAFDRSDELAAKKPIVSVFIEGYLPDERVYVGRTYMDAPDVDGLIFVESDRELMSGDIVTVRVSGSRGYDLTGVLSEED